MEEIFGWLDSHQTHQALEIDNKSVPRENERLPLRGYACVVIIAQAQKDYPQEHASFSYNYSSQPYHRSRDQVKASSLHPFQGMS